jgi:hypothetical protein
MSDPNDVATTYKQHEQLLGKANALNKAAVFDALAAAGLSSVNVTFDGEGDSGQIESIDAYKEESSDPHPLPETAIEVQQASWNSEKLDSRTSSLREAIERLCYDYLEISQGGWENNDGAFGEFQFDVKARTIELEFNARFTDSTFFSHTF